MRFGRTLLTLIATGIFLAGCHREKTSVQEVNPIVNIEELPPKYSWAWEFDEDHGGEKRVVRDSTGNCLGYLEFVDPYKEWSSTSGNLRQDELYDTQVSKGEIKDNPSIKFVHYNTSETD